MVLVNLNLLSNVDIFINNVSKSLKKKIKMRKDDTNNIFIDDYL
jgi:hypothetical protein